MNLRTLLLSVPLLLGADIREARATPMLRTAPACFSSLNSSGWLGIAGAPSSGRIDRKPSIDGEEQEALRRRFSVQRSRAPLQSTGRKWVPDDDDSGAFDGVAAGSCAHAGGNGSSGNPNEVARRSATMPGYSAGQVQRSIRFNTHITRGSPWAGTYNGKNVQSYVEDLLSIPHIYAVRDDIQAVTDDISSAEVIELAKRGVKFDVQTAQDMTAAQMTGWIDAYPKGSVISIEGPNECNISNDPNCYRQIGWPAWAEADRAFSTGALFQAFSATKGGPSGMQDYLATSIAGRTVASAGALLGDLTCCITAGNDHDYGQSGWPEGDSSTDPLRGSIVAKNLAWIEPVSKSLPVFTTERAIVLCCTVKYGVPPDIGGRNSPRMLLFEYLMGIKGVYVYALIESERNISFGSVSGVDYHQTPNYKSIAGLSELLYDPAPLTGDCTVHASVSGPGVVVMAPSARGVSVFNVCKSNGEEDIFLWRPLADYGGGGVNSGGSYIKVPPVNVRVSLLGKPKVSLYTQDPTSGVFSKKAAFAANRLGALPVTDTVEMIQLNGPDISLRLPAEL